MKKGKLYLIPTALGEGTEYQNLPPSVAECIKKINIFIVENIRTARRFVRKIYKNKDIDNTIFYSYGKHDSLDLQENFLSHIIQGNDIGIISEAGVPCVADPGSKIVEFAHQYQIEVCPITGPSSILLALIASGFNGQYFSFNGYLPIDKKERSKKIKDLEFLSKKNGQTQIFMETPYRNLQLFESILKTCSKSTKLCIASDITLPSENIKTRTIEEWISIKPEIHKKPSIFLISQ
ncbi:MAG: SAM-dependent methyltransferase [Flavobacteriales bacterium]|nr:SAM-dependent methyltransferase [Flavobacteriales bacterium]